MEQLLHSTCLETKKQHMQVKDGTCKSVKCINQLQTLSFVFDFWKVARKEKMAREMIFLCLAVCTKISKENQV